jgi:glutamine synthetase
VQTVGGIAALRDVQDALESAAALGVKRVDLKATDLGGRLRHLSFPIHRLEEVLARGVGVAGSHYGWRSGGGEEIVLVPDLATAWVDRLQDVPSLSMLARPVNPASGDPVEGDSRSIAEKAEVYAAEALASRGAATVSCWRAELEFYLVPAALELAPTGLAGELGAGIDGYHATPPGDRYAGFRARLAAELEDAGVGVKYDHHESGAGGQVEIELDYRNLTRAADLIVIAKYIIRNSARRDGLAAIFLPKPALDAPGSGLHVHCQVWQGDHPAFAGPGYGGLSKLALGFVAGILQHLPSLAALTNPSTNSYRRLVPGFEAPVLAGFGIAHREAAIRIPGYAERSDEVCFEYRPLDATANPYLALSALLLAGTEGVQQSLDPTALGFGPLLTGDQPSSAIRFPTTLGQALHSLTDDRDYLLANSVFSRELLDDWIAIKHKEALRIELQPHPIEFAVYGGL